MTDSSPTTLYRLYNADGGLLYVGIAGNPGRRSTIWWSYWTLRHTVSS